MSVHGLRMRRWDGYCWPTFNLADAFITAGVIALVAFELMRGEPDPQAKYC